MRGDGTGNSGRAKEVHLHERAATHVWRPKLWSQMRVVCTACRNCNGLCVGVAIKLTGTELKILNFYSTCLEDGEFALRWPLPAKKHVLVVDFYGSIMETQAVIYKHYQG